MRLIDKIRAKTAKALEHRRERARLLAQQCRQHIFDRIELEADRGDFGVVIRLDKALISAEREAIVSMLESEGFRAHFDGAALIVSWRTDDSPGRPQSPYGREVT